MSLAISCLLQHAGHSSIEQLHSGNPLKVQQMKLGLASYSACVKHLFVNSKRLELILCFILLLQWHWLLWDVTVPDHNQKRGNCQFCDTKRRNKTTLKCFTCKKWICGKHVSKKFVSVQLAPNCI